MWNPFFDSGAWRNARRLLIAAMVVAFILFGVHGIKVARSRRTDGNGSLNSTNAFLLPALGVHGGGEGILNAISGLPPLQPFAIIAPADNIYTPILLPTIGSLTWPHEIGLIQVQNPDLHKIMDTLRNDHFAAAIYFDISPPNPGAGDRHVGLLTVVPIQK